ncbi:MAG: energy transducer TonB, partial [Candidatus Baltobacteraceae bacterium]
VLVLASVALSGAMLLTVVTPARAVVYNDYVPPKLIKQGNSTHGIAGTGVVVVQVQVNADGSHKVIKVIRSSNSGDNSAAMDIAQSASYRVGTRGGKTTTAFYDYTLKFNGKSLAASTTGRGGSSGIDGMLRAGNYAGAKAAAQSAVLSNPANSTAQAQLGAAEYFMKDYAAAAAAFDKAAAIPKAYKIIASSAFSNAGASLAQSNPAQALAYAKKGVAVAPNGGSYFALGVAELGNKDAASAITDLKRSSALASADKKTDSNTRVQIDVELLQAYIANNDQADANATASEIKSLDPTSKAPARVLGNYYLSQGNTAAGAAKHDEAIKAFEQAAASGDPEVQVTAYTSVAFEMSKADKPDYAKVKAEADKALAINPNDAMANFAAGLGLTGEYAGSHDDGVKKQALVYLNKADDLAKTAGNAALQIQIESFMKNNLKQ